MKSLAKRDQHIITLPLTHGPMSSSQIYKSLLVLEEKVSLVTVKRALGELDTAGYVHSLGAGRSTKYEITTLGRLFADIDARTYCAAEPDKRLGLGHYNFDLLTEFPIDVFT